MDLSNILLKFIALLMYLLPVLQACPQNCHCHGGDLHHVICENVGLRRIPKVAEQTRLLNLQRNNFPMLPTNGFREMKNLVSLHLQHSHIKDISSGAFRGLKQLVYLYLSNNDISTIKMGAFDDLTELTYLYLDHNKISDLPKGLLSPLINLFIMQLGNNKLRELRSGAFHGTKNLRWLYLSNNSISSIQPGTLEDVENLAIFHLDKNQLSTYPVSAMSKLRVVEDLKLSDNPIKSIPDLAFQSFGRYMETLSLDNMGLEKFSDKAFIGTTALKNVHIEHNKISRLPKSFPFTRLETLSLSNNPWHCSCQLAPLHRWLGSTRTRPDAVCASPPQTRGQQIRDTAALRGCKLPSKRSKKEIAIRQAIQFFWNFQLNICQPLEVV